MFQLPWINQRLDDILHNVGRRMMELLGHFFQTATLNLFRIFHETPGRVILF